MKTYLFSLLLVLPFSLIAQLKGTITDESGTPLPYVNIYLSNATSGTSTNFEGQYELALEPGNYELNFQYVGYELLTKEITIGKDPIINDIILYQETYQLDQVNISATAEDPAYEIIRKAQAKRKFYKEKYNNYSCDAYMRGFTKVVSAPDKIMGIKVGDFDGALDSTRSGVVYLSESVSKVFFKGNQSKEVMYSSKVSGNDQGYSFNSAKEMQHNFYNNTIEFNKPIVSPIANNAFSHYKYELEGANLDDNGQLVNKIKVIQKNKYGNTFYGHIYINEDLWNIHSLELNTTKHATQVPVLDTVTLKQIFAPVQDDNWILLSNVINFKLGALGFNFEGNFACVYSNYELGSVTDSDLKKVTFEVKEIANTKSDLYWDSIRPIPLTHEEKIDYHRKDSIRIVRESPEYLDSTDRLANKFKIKDLILGYNHRHSLKRTEFDIISPLSNTSLNTIQGWNFSSGIQFTKSYNKTDSKKILASAVLNYGLSEKVYRPNFGIQLLADLKNNFWISIQGGKKLEQYNRTNPITTRLNSIMTLFQGENYMKVYDKEFLSLRISRDLFSGTHGRFSIDYENREAVTNNYFGGLRKDTKTFSSNNPQTPTNDQAAFLAHQALIVRATLTFNIGQKVWLYPDRKFKEDSAWPTISLNYKGGLPVLSSDIDYHLLYGSIFKEAEIGIYGIFNFHLTAGQFIGANKPEYFIDHLHFNGNQTHIGYPTEYTYRFLNLPYYSNSSADNFLILHVHHHFDGYLLKKLPLIKRLGWELAAGYKLLNTNSTYQEIHLGIDNIGFKAVRPLRVDLVYSNQSCPDGLCINKWNPSVVFGAVFKI